MRDCSCRPGVPGDGPGTTACESPPLARPRVLYVAVAPLLPPKLGPTRRNYHIARQLARAYELSILTLGPPEAAAEMHAALGSGICRIETVPWRVRGRLKAAAKIWRTVSGRCDFLPVLEPALRAAVAEVARRDAFDVVVLSSLLLRRLPLPSGVPIVADTHNVEFDVHGRTARSAAALARRMYAAWQAPITKREERRCGRASDLVLATSERDRQIFERELGFRRVAVVPNGVDLAEFAPSPCPPADPTIVFTGLMSYFPNQQGIAWFLDDVFPVVLERIPEARLVVAGAAPPSWLVARRSHQIHVTGELHDLRPLIASAAVVIAPLFIGGGTRVKILEAQAMEKPVVSTAVGAEGLEQRDGSTILLADDPRTFASHVVRLLTDAAAAARLARNGRAHVVSRFDWDRIGGRLRDALGAHFGLRDLSSPAPRHTEANRPCAPTAASIAS